VRSALLIDLLIYWVMAIWGILIDVFGVLLIIPPDNFQNITSINMTSFLTNQDAVILHGNDNLTK